MIVESMTTADALAELGVTPDLLTEEEKRRMDADGYLVIHDVLSAEEITRICARLDELLEEEGDDAGKEIHQEPGTERLANLVDKGSVFQVCYRHPKFLAAMAYFLEGDLKLSALSSRCAMPGEGQQLLHADWSQVITPGRWEGVNSIWLLDDFTEENGTTRVVPGSHRWGKLPPAAEVGSPFVSESEGAENDLHNPATPHPQQRLIIEKAGSVVVFICHLWHSGTVNRTDRRRRAINSFFARREHKSLVDARTSLSAETVEALSPAERVLIDV